MTFAWMEPDRLARAENRVYGRQVWAACFLRQPTRCQLCGEALFEKMGAFRPITNAANRMHRVCRPCMSRACAGERRATTPERG